MSKSNEGVLDKVNDFIVNIIVGCVLAFIVGTSYLMIDSIQKVVPGYSNLSWFLVKLSAALFAGCIVLLNLKKIILFTGNCILRVLKLMYSAFKKPPMPSGTHTVENLSPKATKVITPGTPFKNGLPPLSLLGEVNESKTCIDKSLPAKVEKTFETLDLPIKVKSFVVGASITKFILDMDKSVRIKNLMALKDDIALHLQVDSVNLVSTKEGMALEVPNKERRMVFHRMVMESLRNEQFKELSIILGEYSTGEPFYFDLEIAPHLLVAGATGMGKSVCINTIICSFLMRLTPEHLQLLLIDPKQVEFSMYEPLPHLARPVIKGVDGGIDALKWCVQEMEQRYKILEQMGVKKLHSLSIDKRPFPLMVVIVDELADLILSSGREVNNLISRLAGKARAAGIHLILATQRPSADIISGLIRSNILGRIALKTDKAVESSIILDRNGAETLTGKGEMLVKLPGYSDLVRCQGSFIDDDNMSDIVKWWSSSLPTANQGTAPIEEQTSSKITFNLNDSEELEEDEPPLTEQTSSQAEHILRQNICTLRIYNDNDTEIQLPTIRELSVQLNVSVKPVYQILEILREEGWVKKVGVNRYAKTIITLSKEEAQKWMENFQ